MLSRGDKVLLKTSNDKNLLLKTFTVTRPLDQWGKVRAELTTETHFYTIYTNPKNLVKIQTE